MTVVNAVGNSLTGLTGTGKFVGDTSPTIVTPVIAQINDSNANEILTLTGVASAVNEVNISNAATGNFPVVSATGGDTNIALQLKSKGNGVVQLYGGSGASTAVGVYSGTSYQHTTLFSFSNTSATRTVTFQDADGTLAYLADRGMVLLNTYTSSGVATQDMTNMTGYSNYLVVFQNLTPVTSATSLYLRFSNDNGSTFFSGASDYNYENFSAANATLTAAQSIGSTVINLSNAHNNTAGAGAGGSLLLSNLNSSFNRKSVLYNSIYVNSAGNMNIFQTGGNFAGTQNIDAIRFLFSSGNISTATWQLYGIR